MTTKRTTAKQKPAKQEPKPTGKLRAVKRRVKIHVPISAIKPIVVEEIEAAPELAKPYPVDVVFVDPAGVPVAKASFAARAWGKFVDVVIGR